MRLAIDWDDTLVHDNQWLPGALPALKRLARAHTVVIHSARAGYPGGMEQIRKMLLAARLNGLEIEPKVRADLYIDNQAVLFNGDWPEVLRRVRHHKKES